MGRISEAPKIYLGTQVADRIYLGGALVWEPTAVEEPTEPANMLVNGTFDTDTSGWTLRNGAQLEFVDGTAKLIKGSSANPFIFQTINLVAGKTYRFKGSVVEAANPTASIRIGTSPANLNVINSGSFGVNNWQTDYTATATQLVYYSVVHSSGTIGTFIRLDDLSVQELA